MRFLQPGRRIGFAALACVCLLVGCSDACSLDPTLEADAFDRSCTKADDCAVVAEGSICERCVEGRNWTAINRDDLPSYRSTWDRLASGCAAATSCTRTPPPQYRAFCERGRCTAVALDRETSRRPTNAASESDGQK